MEKAKSTVVKTGKAVGDVHEAKVIREIKKGEKIADIVDEAKTLTYLDDVEHAVVKAADGKRYLVSGGKHGIELPADTKMVYDHTHPNVGKGHINTPSIADREALDQPKQSKQHVFHDGQATHYNL